MKKITIQDISDYTNLSKSTISRVITNKGYVSEKNKEIVLNAIKELKYKPQKSHNMKNNDLIMVIACQLYSDAQLSLIKGICKTLEQRNKKVAIFSVDFKDEIIYEYLNYAYEKNFGGIITLGLLDTELLHKTLKKIKCPIVMLNQSVENLKTLKVSMNDYQGGYDATMYLLKKGHRKICYLTGYKNAIATGDRERGFLDAMADYNILYNDIDIFYKDFDIDSGKEFADELLKNKLNYSAIITGNEMLAVGLMLRLNELGIAIPDEISIISFGDSLLFQNYHPNITVMSYDFKEMGSALAEILVEHINKPLKMIKSVNFNPVLIERESVKDLN